MVKKKEQVKDVNLDNSEKRLKYNLKLEIRCSKCNSRNTYTNKNGEIVCRKCSHRELSQEGLE